MGLYWDPDKINASKISLGSEEKVATSLSGTTDQAVIGAIAAVGSVYFEIEILDFGGYVTLGICNDSHTGDDRSGFNNNSWSWMENGRLYHEGSYSGTTGFSGSDILQVAIDVVNNRVWFGKNNTWIESGDPANGINPCFEDSGITGNIFPCFSPRYDGDSVQLRVLDAEFSYTPPAGFSAWGVQYKIAGSVGQEGAGVSRVVRAYNRSTGALSGETTSAADGSFEILLGSDSEVYAVALDDSDGTDYNALIYDRIIPVAV
jgi:hypothetical protein